jgi:hypothetical protein
MSLLKKKSYADLPPEIRDLSTILKIEDSNLELKGSASYKILKFYSDFDFLCFFKKRDISKLYDDIKYILEKIISDQRYYFIELKIQSKKGEKFRFHYNDDFNFEKFKKDMKNNSFFKIDIVAFLNNSFFDVSCLYMPLTILNDNMEEELEKKIKIEVIKEIKELKKENKYFKILKRQYFLYSFHPKSYYEEMKDLVTFFNSRYGEMYQKKSELEACKNVLDLYHDDLTINRAKLFLKSIGEDESDYLHLDKLIDKYNNIINEEAKKFQNV